MRHCSKRKEKKEQKKASTTKEKEEKKTGRGVSYSEQKEKKSLWFFFKEKGALQGNSLLKRCFVQKRIAFLQPAELDEIGEEEKKRRKKKYTEFW